MSEVNLMLGDCLERMKEFPDESVDALISDIPYGINISSWDVLHDNNNSALLGSSPPKQRVGCLKAGGNH